MILRLAVLTAAAGLLMAGFNAAPAAAADGATGELPKSGCPEFGVPTVEVVQRSGHLSQSVSKTAFDLAREKSKRYRTKMPLRQGNNGRPRFRVTTDVELVPYPSIGCIAVKSVISTIVIDHEIEIAAEHEPGSCVYAELINLETELMQQDELIINREVAEMQQNLKGYFKSFNAYGPVTGIDLDEAIFKQENKIKNMIQGMVDNVAEKAENVRRETDLPEFYDEIVADCSGG